MIQVGPITVVLKVPIAQASLLQVLAQAIVVVPHLRVAALLPADLMEAEVNPFHQNQLEQDNLNHIIL